MAGIRAQPFRQGHEAPVLMSGKAAARRFWQRAAAGAGGEGYAAPTGVWSRRSMPCRT